MPSIDIKVPDIGDFKDVAIIEVLVKPGDTVKAEQSLITVESDKASMEIPSSHAGVVKEVKVKIGETVNQGTVILALEAADSASVSPPAANNSGHPDPSIPQPERVWRMRRLKKHWRPLHPPPPATKSPSPDSPSRRS